MYPFRYKFKDIILKNTSGRPKFRSTRKRRVKPQKVIEDVIDKEEIEKSNKPQPIAEILEVKKESIVEILEVKKESIAEILEVKKEPTEKERFYIGVSPKGSRGGNFYKIEQDYAHIEQSGAEAKASKAKRKQPKSSIHHINLKERPTSHQYDKYF